VAVGVDAVNKERSRDAVSDPKGSDPRGLLSLLTMEAHKFANAYEETLRQETDQRDAVQKKTFTKWVNKHLIKCNQLIGDLFADLRSGHNLINLLEILSQERLPRERGMTRFHKLQNVQIALDFLAHKKIRLVNIRADEIVDGNSKLTLGLIWTIILHFQISDVIVSGQDSNITAKEALLLWSRRMCAGYPGVHIRDFTHSWRDGLAFLAILHRHRPDLIDYRQARRQTARQNLEMAFNIAERECGVTRLLDPEDVDVPEPDEKSLITYVSCLYDVFPDVPSAEQTIRDSEAQLKLEEYEEVAGSLIGWIRDATTLMLDRNFPRTYTELKMYSSDFNRFRMEEVPRRLKDKYRLQALHDALQDMHADPRLMSLAIDDELHFDNINRMWERFSHAQHEKDLAIIAEISRLERIQRLAEKVHHDCKSTEDQLDDVERRLQEDAQRLGRLHPSEAKRCCDAISRSLGAIEGNMHAMMSDVQALRDGQYHQVEPLHRRVQMSSQRLQNLTSMLQSNIRLHVSSRPIPDERTLSYRSEPSPGTGIPVGVLPQSIQLLRNAQKALDWVLSRQAELDNMGYGKDLDSVRDSLELQKKAHEEIIRFQQEITECASAKRSLSGQDAVTYGQCLARLENAYSQLENTSQLRLRSLESLLSFMERAVQELAWLGEKEEMEVSRDWSSQNLQINELEDHYEQLTSELEMRESQFSSIQDHGESLVMDRHPASAVIKSMMASMQTQWAWLLQLTSCLDTHMKHAVQHQQFYDEAHDASHWINRQKQLLTERRSRPNISLEDGEKMLREMQEVKQATEQYEGAIRLMISRSRDVPPLKLRSQRLLHPIQLTALCSYKHLNMSIAKGEDCTLLDNSRRTKWRVRNGAGVEGLVPAVCFCIPPPNKDAEDLARSILRDLESLKHLWQDAQRQLKRRMIFATIDVIRSWNLAQFQAIGVTQRDAILKALNEDVEKLIQEYGPYSQEAAELRDALRQCEDIYRQLDAQLDEQARKPSADQQLTNEMEQLLADLDQLERKLTTMLQESLPVDVGQVNSMIAKYKEFERAVMQRNGDVEACQQHYEQLSPAQHTAHVEQKYRLLLDRWQQLLGLLRPYSDRLDASKVLLTEAKGLQELLTSYEQRLSTHSHLSSDASVLKQTCEQLQVLQTSLQQNQRCVDGLQQETSTLKQLVARTRPGMTHLHLDVQHLESDLEQLITRWENLVIQVTDRHSNACQALENLNFYQNAQQTEQPCIDSLENHLSRLAPITGRPEDAQKDMELVMKLYNEAKGRKFPMEALNKYGGKFVKEVKMYERHMKQYMESLGASQLPKAPAQTSDTVVVGQMNQLNQRYMRILTELHQRLMRMKKIYDDAGIYFPYKLELEAPGIRTFQSELRVLDADDPSLASWLTSSSRTSATATMITTGCDVADIFQPRHHRGVQTVVNEEVTSHVPKAQFLRATGVTDPKTGRHMTLAEAADIGLFDVAGGKFVDPKTGRRLSLSQAVRLGLVDADLANELQQKSGVRDAMTGRELTTVEALQQGAIDLATGNVHDARTGRLLTPDEAVSQGLLSRDAASRLSRSDIVTQSTSLSHGFYGMADFPSTELSALPLYDVVDKGLYNTASGKVIEPMTRSEMTLEEAIYGNIVDPTRREVLDLATGDVITLTDAIRKGIINPRTGKYVDTKTKAVMSLDEATAKGYIRKQVMLYNAITSGILGASGQLQDVSKPGSKRLTLLEAIEQGILDTDFKCIMDTRTGELLSLREAVERGLIRVNMLIQ
jgi:hypothetical protein